MEVAVAAGSSRAPCQMELSFEEHAFAAMQLVTWSPAFSQTLWNGQEALRSSPAQKPTPELRAAARAAAGTLGLPLQEREVGDAGLEHQLEELVLGTASGATTRIRARAA